MEIYAIHRSATPQEIERANWDNAHEDIFAIATVLGENLTREPMPATAVLYGMPSISTKGIFVAAAKKFAAVKVELRKALGM